jgi:hypothetical protein
MQVEPSRKIWGPRLSVRAMMLLVLALGLWLGWMTYCARDQRDAVEAITRSGGYVVYDRDLQDPFRRQHARFFEWLEDLIGIDYLSHVSEIAFDGRATDADLMEIGRLSRLQRLSISSSPISDDGLKNLRGLTSLRQLFLHGTSISDEALVNLQGLARLELLTLVDTQITDAGLTHLRRLRCLQELDVPSRISDRAIQTLQRDLASVQVNRGLPYGFK